MANKIISKSLYIQMNMKLNLSFIIMISILMINFIKSDNCLITNRTIITTQWLNNIICLGDDNFRYVNFATSSDNDMIIETTAIPDSPKRMFYGIKSNGEPFFSNGQYHSTIVISNQTESNNARYEGEIFL